MLAAKAPVEYDVVATFDVTDPGKLPAPKYTSYDVAVATELQVTLLIAPPPE